MKEKKRSSAPKEIPSESLVTPTSAHLPKLRTPARGRNWSKAAAFAGYKYQPQVSPEGAEQPIVIRHENLENAADPELVIARALFKAWFLYLARAGKDPIPSIQ